MQLQDGIEIAPDQEFALAYTVVEGSIEKPTKIHVREVSLVDVPYLAKKKKSSEA